MLHTKFHQNQIINEILYILDGRGGWDPPICEISVFF